MSNPDGFWDQFDENPWSSEWDGDVLEDEDAEEEELGQFHFPEDEEEEES